MSEKRGVGIEATLGIDAVVELARLAEELGYSNCWFNVPTGDPDPIEMLARVQQGTQSIEIGVGVFPLDRMPPQTLAQRLKGIEIDRSRVILCVGAGQAKQGVVDLVGAGIAALRAALPGVRLGIGGYGPKVLNLAGRVADVLNPNWMSAERLAWAIARMKEGAAEAHRPPPAVYLYHRTAQGPDAAAMIETEMTNYRRYPVQARHQAAMGNPRWVGLAAETPADIDRQLAPYMSLCVPVLKLRPREAKDLAEWQSLVRFFAPR